MPARKRPRKPGPPGTGTSAACRYLYRRTKCDVSEAERLFNLALELDNTLGSARCVLCPRSTISRHSSGDVRGGVSSHGGEEARGSERSIWDNQDPGHYCALARANMMRGPTMELLRPTRKQHWAWDPAWPLDVSCLRIVASLRWACERRASWFTSNGRSLSRCAPRGSFYGGDCRGGNLFPRRIWGKALEWARRSIRQPRSTPHLATREAALAAALAQLGLHRRGAIGRSRLLREWPGLTICLLCQPVPPETPRISRPLCRGSEESRSPRMTTRRLAAILAADVVGSSRLIEADEGYALTAIREVLHDVLVGTAASHGGRLIKTMGDGALLEFASPVAAVTCATAVQSALAERAASEPEDRRVLLRIGVNLGDVVAQSDGDLYGDGVNIAARLESIAHPGGIAISGKVHDELQGKVSSSSRIAESRASRTSPDRCGCTHLAGARSTRRPSASPSRCPTSPRSLSCRSRI